MKAKEIASQVLLEVFGSKEGFDDFEETCNNLCSTAGVDPDCEFSGEELIFAETILRHNAMLILGAIGCGMGVDDVS